jgi:protein gp37
MLGPIDFRKVPGFNRVGLDLSGWWIICGGESGPKARPMHPDWVRSLRDQCAAADVPFLFKQWGEWAPNYLTENGERIESTMWMDRMGKKAAGRLLDGREHSEFPA